MTTRRTFLLASLATTAAICTRPNALLAETATALTPLKEFDYSAVSFAPGLFTDIANKQFSSSQKVLLNLDEDSILKPWRKRAGLPAPGPSMGGWYDEIVNEKTPSGGGGFAPAEAFGQWLSALARGYAITGDARAKAKVERVLALYEPTISPLFYKDFRFPAYNYDKTVLALIDAQKFLGTRNAYALLDRVTDAAEPWLPPTALDRDEPQRKWRASIGEPTTDDYTWDESYTMPENLYLAADRGAGERYRRMARKYLLNETWFDPLAENKNVLANHHAYSFCNSMSSAAQAWLSDGSEKHLVAATNAFRMLSEQSFATGGWGPDESFVAPGDGKLLKSLTETHRGFETPCGSYAHFKLTRKLLQITRDGRYGDSMERVLYNTILGALPLMSDGRCFYYSDYNFNAQKNYFPDAWPCCSGTFPQVAADYHILGYFHSTEELFVNLYLPSTLRWVHQSGAEIELAQTTNYPIDSRITLRLKTSRTAQFPISFRIPAWTPGVSIQINGKPMSYQLAKGFARIERRWQTGDAIELVLPLPLRVEPIDAEHPNTVALMRGPLVLFAIDANGPITLTRKALLSVQQIEEKSLWRTEFQGKKIDLMPFVGIESQPYSTYVNLV